MATTTKPKKKIDDSDAATEACSVGDKDDDDHHEELMVHVMHDHLDVMLAIIMKLREDPHYASTIYSDCPRLQHILNQHPDLRPIFEDPKFVCLNFEQVYRKAGGVLPEDKPNYFKIIVRKIVTHPLFKVLKVVLFIKKIVTCILGGGIGLLTSLFSTSSAANAAVSAADNADADAGDPLNQDNREALNSAADYMEQPEVQEKMQLLIESNPDNLDEAIEQDPELRALRDSNPLCAELMKDPETMRILMDPDNLRTLADCPELIEQDFNDPNWTPPEIQPGTFDETTVTVPEDALPTEANMPEDAAPVENSMPFEDFEMEETEDDGGMEAAGAEDDRNSSMHKSRSGRSMSSSKSFSSKGASFTASIRDYVAAELVGSTADDALGLDDAAPEVDTAAIEDAADENIENVQGMAESTADMAGNVEDAADKIEETHEDAEDNDENDTSSRAGVVATSTVAGGAIGAAAATATNRSQDDDTDTNNEKSSSLRSTITGGVGSIFSSISTAAKEKLATTLLGDDLGEHMMEKMEEHEEEKGSQDTGSEGQQDTKRSAMSRLGSII